MSHFFNCSPDIISFHFEDEGIIPNNSELPLVLLKGAIEPELAGGGLVLLSSPSVEPKEMFDCYYELVTIPETHAEFRPIIDGYREIRSLAEPSTDQQICNARAAHYRLCEHIDRLAAAVQR